MPMASANASPRIMLVWITGWASGLRPRASSARPTMLPMPRAGPKAPSPIAIPAPMYLIPLSLIENDVVSCWATSRTVSITGATIASNRSIYQSSFVLGLTWLHMLDGFVCAFLCLRFVFGRVAAVRHCHDAKNESQHREDEGLDNANEEFEAIEHERQKEGGHEGEHEDHYLSREHIPEETGGEAEQTDELRNEFEEADEGVDRSLKKGSRAKLSRATKHASEVEGLTSIAEESEGSYAPGLDRNCGYDRERKRGIEVGVGPAEEGQKLTHSLAFLVGLLELLLRVRVVRVDTVGAKAARAREGHVIHVERANGGLFHHKAVLLLLDTANDIEGRQEREPVGGEHEEEDGGDDREEAAAVFLAGDIDDEVEERLDDGLDHVLGAVRHHLPAAGRQEYDDDHRQDNQTRCEHGVCDVDRANAEQRFGLDRDMRRGTAEEDKTDEE